jgi:hypothetical protein
MPNSIDDDAVFDSEDGSGENGRHPSDVRNDPTDPPNVPPAHAQTVLQMFDPDLLAGRPIRPERATEGAAEALRLALAGAQFRDPGAVPPADTLRGQRRSRAEEDRRLSDGWGREGLLRSRAAAIVRRSGHPPSAGKRAAEELIKALGHDKLTPAYRDTVHRAGLDPWLAEETALMAMGNIHGTRDLKRAIDKAVAFHLDRMTDEEIARHKANLIPFDDDEAELGGGAERDTLTGGTAEHTVGRGGGDRRSEGGQEDGDRDDEGPTEEALAPVIVPAIVLGLPVLIAAFDQLRRTSPGSRSGGGFSSFQALPPEKPQPPRDFDADDLPETDIPGLPATAEPIPDIPGFPIPDEPGILIEYFPDESERILLPMIVESRGGPRTQALNDKVRGVVEDVVGSLGANVNHIGGARTFEGIKSTETFLKGPDEKNTRKESSRLDLTFEHDVTERLLLINTIDTLADQVSPDKREFGAAVRIILNSRNGDILILIPKVPDDGTLPTDELAEFIEPFIVQLGREVPDFDPRSITPQDEFWRLWNLFIPKMR